MNSKFMTQTLAKHSIQQSEFTAGQYFDSWIYSASKLNGERSAAYTSKCLLVQLYTSYAVG